MSNYVYILYSKKLGSFYRGQTNDLKDRLLRHNGKRVSSTKNGSPWILIWTTKKANRSEAVKLETKLKNLGYKRLIEFMLKYKDEITSPDELNLLIQLSGC